MTTRDVSLYLLELPDVELGRLLRQRIKDRFSQLSAAQLAEPASESEERVVRQHQAANAKAVAS